MFRTILVGCLALGILFSAQVTNAAENPDSTYVSDASDATLFRALFDVTAAQAQKVALGLGSHQGLTDSTGALRAATLDEIKAELKSRARAWFQQYAVKQRAAAIDTLTAETVPALVDKDL